MASAGFSVRRQKKTHNSASKPGGGFPRAVNAAFFLQGYYVKEDM
jgi:hypothetical protein